MIAYSEVKAVMRNFDLINSILSKSTFEEFVKLVNSEQIRLMEKCHDYIGNGSVIPAGEEFNFRYYEDLLFIQKHESKFIEDLCDIKSTYSIDSLTYERENEITNLIKDKFEL